MPRVTQHSTSNLTSMDGANPRLPLVLGCICHCWGLDVQGPELTPGNKAKPLGF